MKFFFSLVLNLLIVECYANVFVVTIENYVYSPSSLFVKQGDTVIWVNKDGVPHDVYFDDKTFISEVMYLQDSVTYIASQPGHFSYVCSYHLFMKAGLTIEAPTTAVFGSLDKVITLKVCGLSNCQTLLLDEECREVVLFTLAGEHVQSFAPGTAFQNSLVIGKAGFYILLLIRNDKKYWATKLEVK